MKKLAALFSLLALTLHATPLRTNGVYVVFNQPASVSVAWNLETDPTVVGYNVYYGAASLTYTNVISVGNTNYCTISNLAFGATYYFTCTAVTAAGLESGYASEISWTVPGLPPPPTNDTLTNKVVSIQFGTGPSGPWSDVGAVLYVDAAAPSRYYRLLIR